MKCRKAGWSRVRHAPALLALALSLAFAPSARATEAEPADSTEDGWKKVLAYGRCAFSVFKAVTPTEWASAFFDCGRTFLDEPSAGAKP